MVDLRELPNEDPEMPPAVAGWYAGCHCWDANEGAFPDAYYWDGKEWAHDFPMVYYKPHRFDTEDAALKAAQDADLGW